jgi:uncharacterized C2H2 Zn-finger protein
MAKAYVPSNISKFAESRGVTRLVNKVAGWAEKSGKRITGGTAIGKYYSTLILDMRYNGSEIYIDLNTHEVKLFGEVVNSPKSFLKVLNQNTSELVGV